MKKLLLLFMLLAGIIYIHAQPKNKVHVVIECYKEYYRLNKSVLKPAEEPPPIPLQAQTEQPKEPEAKPVEPPAKKTPPPVCIPEPEDFYEFFDSKFIDFKSLREGEKVKTFSFSDSMCSPLRRDLVITSVYGMRGNRKHFGVDFRVNIGDTVCSIFCGKVRIAKWDDQYGLVVVVRNYNMSETVYAHLDKVFVRVDQHVRVGQPIGTGGNTGKSSAPHLHFELRYHGFPINPIVKDKFLMQVPASLKK